MGSIGMLLYDQPARQKRTFENSAGGVSYVFRVALHSLKELEVLRLCSHLQKQQQHHQLHQQYQQQQ